MTRVQIALLVAVYLGLEHLVAALPPLADGENFSYHRFSGPVSGELKQVVYNKQNPKYKDVDFEAKPDYSYIYGVQDNGNGNSQAHKEMRDGDNVRGEYRVLQPDGKIRIVRYLADPVGGFTATVEYMSVPTDKIE